jgi:HEAT repeat protein
MATNPQAPDEMSRQSVQHTAITSLGFIGARIQDKDNQVLFYLLKMTKDPNPRTRVVAVQAVARMAGRGAIPAMLEMARQEKDNTALLFEVSAIYKAGGAQAVEALQLLQKQAQDDKNAYLLELSEEALLRLQRERRTG